MKIQDDDEHDAENFIFDCVDGGGFWFILPWAQAVVSKVIFDTDIGDDIDDAYALGLSVARS